MINQSSTLLGYQPHHNLSINNKSADQCNSLTEIRYEIDTIDHFIIKLMYTRMQYALATLKFKLDGKPIPDNQRIIQQLKQRKKWAEQYGLDQKFIESFFKLMIDWYMTQQINYYQNTKHNQQTLQIKFSSLPQLKSMEFDLDWINISQYNQLLISAHEKARKLNEPILVSFTQNITTFSDNQTLTTLHPFYLFDQARRLSLSHGFLFSHPSEQFIIVALGTLQQFDLNQNILPFNNINNKIDHFTEQEFHSQVKQIVDNGWKRLLINAIIENGDETNFYGNGPILTGGFSFDLNNNYQSDKWSKFSKASFVLPEIQFTIKNGKSYLTLNTIINEYDIQSIDTHIIYLLQLLNQLLNQQKQYQDQFFNLSLEHKSIPSPDTFKQTVRHAIDQIINGHFKKVRLSRQIEIKTDQQNNTYNMHSSLTRIASRYPSSYLYALLKEDACFFGVTSSQLVRLTNDQLESTIITNTINTENHQIEDNIHQPQLFNPQQSLDEHNLLIDLIKKKLESLTETNSFMIPDKPMVLQLDKQDHLYTSLRATIRKDITLLDLVQTLHPTPDITGFPQLDALKFIRENDSLDRGWFAGTIGWIDSNNNGQFILPFKSLLINQGFISLYADCDITDHSDPQDKFNQTNSKMQTILLDFDDKQLLQ